MLRPPQLKPTSNPFLKTPEADDESKKDKETEKEKSNEKEDTIPIFVPLGSTNTARSVGNPVPTPAQPGTGTSSSGFVFGQNLSERVVNVNNGESKQDDHSSSNGTSELLFTNAAASVKDNNQVCSYFNH